VSVTELKDKHTHTVLKKDIHFLFGKGKLPLYLSHKRYNSRHYSVQYLMDTLTPVKRGWVGARGSQCSNKEKIPELSRNRTPLSPSHNQ
jgi:hypothetical protein